MSRKNHRTAALQAKIAPPSPSREKQYHCLTLRPGQTRDEAVEAYGAERIAEGDVVYLLEYISPTRGRFHPDDPRPA